MPESDQPISSGLKQGEIPTRKKNHLLVSQGEVEDANQNLFFEAAEESAADTDAPIYGKGKRENNLVSTTSNPKSKVPIKKTSVRNDDPRTTGITNIE
jgi:hypothetical protein